MQYLNRPCIYTCPCSYGGWRTSPAPTVLLTHKSSIHTGSPFHGLWIQVNYLSEALEARQYAHSHWTVLKPALFVEHDDAGSGIRSQLVVCAARRSGQRIHGLGEGPTELIRIAEFEMLDPPANSIRSSILLLYWLTFRYCSLSEGNFGFKVQLLCAQYKTDSCGDQTGEARATCLQSASPR